MMYRLLGFRHLKNRGGDASLDLFSSSNLSRFVHSLPFATVKAEEISGSRPAEGNWTSSSSWNTIPDPLNGESFIKVAEVDEKGIQVSDFFAKLIQRVSPKSYQQALGEVYVTQKFLENFCGDQVRFLARSFAVPGNHLGQQSHGFRWPYGPVTIITPFNFPLEIPLLQLMGALYMGNKPLLKVDSKVCVVMEQMLRLLHECGLPLEDVDFINSDGHTMNKILLETLAWRMLAKGLKLSRKRVESLYCGNLASVLPFVFKSLKAKPRMTLFTGSSRVAEKLAVDLKGRVKLEDAGFDWKILGLMSTSGQKCSAQSLLFMHELNIDKLTGLAARRKLDDLTIGPVLTVTTEAMLVHMNKLLEIKGSKLLFGGEALQNHNIPAVYGAIKPTAVFIPLEEILNENNYELVTKEIFGPFQIVTEYKHNQLSLVLNVLERMHAHLTAAVVSNDPLFLQVRTAGDPRGAGIGTPEAIRLVWSCHREVIYDIGPLPQKWRTPQPT
ncbi:hypothetical protein DH2020_042950 [Rehmannia glutinosa]|uniref:Aldehyde dehydrogenase domain-containing protein n=1 Tax=Rehmannia glutinosa TaxID=99300 RepID=A0ABR0ULY9_REHGL